MRAKIYPGKMGLRVSRNVRVERYAGIWERNFGSQSMEIELGPGLLMSEHSRDEPALPWR
jgi:hypothetical protein